VQLAQRPADDLLLTAANLAAAKASAGLHRPDRWPANPVLRHSCWRLQATDSTVESLEQNGQLHPVQQAFLDAGAMQCGYCTPGMIMSGVALLAKHPQPTRDEIIDGMNGNICRCGTYPRIIAALQRAAEMQTGGRR
jgi:hypothetical protein